MAFVGGVGHVKCGVNRLNLLCFHFAHEALQARCVIRPFVSSRIVVRPSILRGRSAMSASLYALHCSAGAGDAGIIVDCPTVRCIIVTAEVVHRILIRDRREHNQLNNMIE
jgi:hypothetical protein